MSKRSWREQPVGYYMPIRVVGFVTGRQTGTRYSSTDLVIQWTSLSDQKWFRHQSVRLSQLQHMLCYQSESRHLGTVEWPAGRILLQWCLDGGIRLDNARILEVGSGVGTTAVGLAKAAKVTGASTIVIASDVDDEALKNLNANAILNEIDVDAGMLKIEKFDASKGNADELIKYVQGLTHLIGADVAYYGGCSSLPSTSSAGMKEERGGLASTIAHLIQVNPTLDVTLVLIDRFSGPAVSAITQQTGMRHEPVPDVDPAISFFESECRKYGLEARREKIEQGVFDRVAAGQSYLQRAAWLVCGYTDGMYLYRIRSGSRTPEKADEQDCH